MSDMQSPQPARRQRNRQTLVCRNCRNRKVKCDRGTPCGPCQKMKSHCSYGSLPIGSPRPTTVVIPHNVPARVSTIETPSTPSVGFNSFDTLSSLFKHGVKEAHVPRHQSLQPATPQSLQQDPFLVEEPCMAGAPTVISDVHRTTDGTFSKTRLFGRSHWMHALGRVLQYLPFYQTLRVTNMVASSNRS